ncbi:MAG: universal stress protein [Candidatus Promineifilaceae bacterium]|nr:universal stress protein [Candidatus Promineifilaceae bacterium]
MYERILVPLDGSERAEAILPHVETLAVSYEAEVLLLHVVEPNVVFTSPYDAYPEMNMEEAERRVEEARAYLNRLVKRLERQGITVREIVEYGPIVLSILDVATAQDVSLIAMASHGRSGLARVFYGSVAAGVLQRVDRPLFLVRSR